MRTYGQYCAVAKSLDVLGDRWTILILRELLIRDGLRYTDLREALPGIASNLLADRLRELGKAGLIAREEAPAPIASTLFRLTERGREARPVIEELGRWGAAAMVEGPAPGDVFQSQWLAFPAELYLHDSAPDEPPVTLEVRIGDEVSTIATGDGEVSVTLGAPAEPDAVLAGEPQLILGVLSGQLDLADARRLGLEFGGDAAVLD